MTLGECGHWLGTRTGFGGTATLPEIFWPHPMAPWTAGVKITLFLNLSQNFKIGSTVLHNFTFKQFNFVKLILSTSLTTYHLRYNSRSYIFD